MNVGRMLGAVEMLESESLAVPGMTDDLHDELHEAITKGMAWLGSGESAEDGTGRWSVEHGFIPSFALTQALGTATAHRVLVQAWRQRTRLQDMFDGIDQFVVVK